MLAHEDIIEKKVQLSELFYDLVFVYAVSQATELLHYQHEAHFGTFLIVMTVMTSAWLYQSIYINRFGDNSWRDRFFLFANMFLLLWLSNAVNSNWQVYFVPFQSLLAALVGTVCLQYLLQLPRIKTTAERRGLWTVIAMRGFTVVALLAALSFEPHIGRWVALGGVGISWFLPMFFSQKQPPVNFPHLLERLGGLVIIVFGETIIDIAPYFNPRHFESDSLWVLGTVFALFAYYAIQFNHITQHRQHTSGALLAYSHYAVLTGISMVTSALAWLHQDVADTVFAAQILWAGLGLFYAGVQINQPYNQPAYRHTARLNVLQIGLFIISGGAAYAAVDNADRLLQTVLLTTILMAISMEWFSRQAQADD